MNPTRTFTTRFILATLVLSLAGALLVSMPTTSRAEEDTTTTEITTTADKKVKIKKAKVDATCMQTAVDARESALMSSWDDFAVTQKTGLTTRKTALNDAWGLSDLKAQKKAIADAWKAWNKTSGDAHKELKTDRKATWDSFKKKVKDTCKVTTPKEEALGKDASGSISL